MKNEKKLLEIQNFQKMFAVHRGGCRGNRSSYIAKKGFGWTAGPGEHNRARGSGHALDQDHEFWYRPEEPHHASAVYTHFSFFREKLC